MSDADDYRRESRESWGSASAGWKQNADALRDLTMPVSAWMVEAIAPQPGHVVLELAAGTGDVGYLAAELIEPGGTLITTDFAPEMLTVAQERAEELGLRNVRFKQVDAESIDLEAGSVDGVLCRWGYMLMADPAAALRETRRVLRPGGRLALAAWSSPADNPWSSEVRAELVRRGLLDAPKPDEPGPFAWAARGHIEAMLGDAGFVEDIRVETVDMQYRMPSFEAWWETTLAMSSRAARATAGLAADEVEDLQGALRRAAQPYADEDGRLVFPARTWAAAATA